MEISVLILVLVGIWLFKKVIKRVVTHADRVITNELNESLEEMVDNSTTIYNNIKAKYGDDFKSPDDVFKLLTSKPEKRASGKKGE